MDIKTFYETKLNFRFPTPSSQTCSLPCLPTSLQVLQLKPSWFFPVHSLPSCTQHPICQAVPRNRSRKVTLPHHPKATIKFLWNTATHYLFLTVRLLHPASPLQSILPVFLELLFWKQKSHNKSLAGSVLFGVLPYIKGKHQRLSVVHKFLLVLALNYWASLSLLSSHVAVLSCLLMRGLGHVTCFGLWDVCRQNTLRLEAYKVLGGQASLHSWSLPEKRLGVGGFWLFILGPRMNMCGRHLSLICSLQPLQPIYKSRREGAKMLLYVSDFLLTALYCSQQLFMSPDPHSTWQLPLFFSSLI